MPAKQGRIYVGIGGWTYEPWHGVFYPKGQPHSRELHYAAEHLTSIEVNGTFYSTQSPKTFRKWASETPEDFVFSLKGPRYAVNRRVLAEAGDSIERFLESGIAELGEKLGPLLWQFAPTKKFDDADFGKFLELLPPKLDGRPLRHVVEVRHESFCTPAFASLLRKFSIPIVFSEHATYPAIADLTGDFVYARLQKGKDSVKTGYPPKALDQWAKHAAVWAKGGRAGGPAAYRQDKNEKSAARRLSLFYPRREETRPRCSDGADRAPRPTLTQIESERGIRAPAASGK